MIELGKKARDKVTGFEGIITGHCRYLYGCDQYLLKPQVKSDGSMIDGEWMDEGRIEVIGDGIDPEEVQTDEPGGFQSDCPPCR